MATAKTILPGFSDSLVEHLVRAGAKVLGQLCTRLLGFGVGTGFEDQVNCVVTVMGKDT